MKNEIRRTIVSLVGITTLLFVIAWAIFPLHAATSGLQEPIRVDGGLISGTPAWGWGVRLYRGIPYAAPPVGNLRWRPPQPAAAWQGVLAADHFSAKCMQSGGFAQASVGPMGALWDEPGTSVMSEDCLYLNIWTPAKSANDKLPVMVFFHGGGLKAGEGSEAIFDGSMMAKKGVIWVTVNYRLNVLGFFAHPELTAESEHHASGNYGEFDMLAAIRWVKNNIAQFGGDPNLITIVGHSGGSRSMNYLMASPLAKGLFQRVISHSHAVFGRIPTLAEAEAKGVEFQKAVGAPNLAALRSMTAQDLETSLKKNDPNAGEADAIVEGWFLPEDVYTIFATGKQNDVPLLNGGMNDEGSGGGGTIPYGYGAYFMNYMDLSAHPPKTPVEYVAWAKKAYGDQAGQFLKVYPGDSEAAIAKSVHDVGRDSNLTGHRTWVQIQTKTGKSQAFLYLFSHKPPVPSTPGSQLPVIGALHGAEFYYTFDNLHIKDLPWTDTDRKVADIASSYWVNFAKTGDPNGAGLPRWPAYNAKDDQLMNLGDNPQAEPVPNKAGLDFLASWEQHFRVSGQSRAEGSGHSGN